MIIHPTIIVTPDSPTVQFRDPRELVDLDVEIPKILRTQGWDIGTYFDVQFISHDRSAVLMAGRFIVTQARESLVTSTANPDAPMTKAISVRMAEQIGDWWHQGISEQKRHPGRPRKDAA